MTTTYIKELFDIFNGILNETLPKKELLIIQLIVKCYENLNDINELFKGNKSNIDPNINSLDKLFEYTYNGNEKTENIYIKFLILIDKIRSQIFNLEDVKRLLELNKKSFGLFDEEMKNFFLITNEEILKKNKELFNLKRIKEYKEKLTKIHNLEILQSNKNEFKQIIDDFIFNISKKIKYISDKYNDILSKIAINVKSININFIGELNDIFILKYFNNYFNSFIKNIKKSLIDNINKNEFIKILFEHFKKNINDFNFPSLKDVVEDLIKKYESFKNNIYEVDIKQINIKKLLQYDELFNTNNGEWKTDIKKDPQINKYK